MTRTQSGELILHAIDIGSSSDANGCDVQSNAGDSPISYQGNAGEVTTSTGQTDLGVAPVEGTAKRLDSSTWSLPSDTPEDISLGQLAYSGDLQKNIKKNSEHDSPTLDTLEETGDLSDGKSSRDATWSLFND